MQAHEQEIDLSMLEHVIRLAEDSTKVEFRLVLIRRVSFWRHWITGAGLAESVAHLHQSHHHWVSSREHHFLLAYCLESGETHFLAGPEITQTVPAAKLEHIRSQFGHLAKTELNGGLAMGFGRTDPTIYPLPCGRTGHQARARA